MAQLEKLMSLAQLTIFGAGLIGGSLALAARKRGLARRIVAIDLDDGSPTGAFDRWIVEKDKEAVQVCLQESSLTILCVPVGAIIEVLPFVLSSTSGWVTDCGSTKAAICDAVKNCAGRGQFVAGHPMAGHPQGGLKNARDDLFEGRKWLLCPEGSSAEGSEVVRNFIEGVGAHVLELTAREHDSSVAITSHVPQVVASALWVHAEEHNALRAAGPGFASATRVAGGAEAMWRDIFETNGTAIGGALVQMAQRLQTLGEQLTQSNTSGCLDTLEKARKLRDESD